MKALIYLALFYTVIASWIAVIRLKSGWRSATFALLAPLVALLYVDGVARVALFLIGMQALFFAGHILYKKGHKGLANISRGVGLAILYWAGLQGVTTPREQFLYYYVIPTGFVFGLFFIATEKLIRAWGKKTANLH